MYDDATMTLKNKNGLWEFSEEKFTTFPQNSGDTLDILTDSNNALNVISGKGFYLKKEITILYCKS